MGWTQEQAERLIVAVEQIAETQRLSHELSIDSLAKTNSLTDEMGNALGGLLSSFGFRENDDPED